jgi:hypothetical protein
MQEEPDESFKWSFHQSRVHLNRYLADALPNISAPLDLRAIDSVAFIYELTEERVKMCGYE